MNESRKPMPHGFDDDAPDLAAPEWRKKFAKAKVQRGRPKAARTKVSTTIRLSPEVVEHFKAGGPGWQSRIDEALRKAAGLQS
ncbi:MAG: BrnA antitoxin family protein [Rhizobiaceae bacterium]